MSWRDLIRVHPAADLFPMMSDDELRVLGKDIRKKGLNSAVILWANEAGGPIDDYQLLDGRNRLEALERVGLRIIMGDSGLVTDGGTRLSISETKLDPYEYVISANILR